MLYAPTHWWYHNLALNLQYYFLLTLCCISSCRFWGSGSKHHWDGSGCRCRAGETWHLHQDTYRGRRGTEGRQVRNFSIDIVKKYFYSDIIKIIYEIIHKYLQGNMSVIIRIKKLTKNLPGMVCKLIKDFINKCVQVKSNFFAYKLLACYNVERITSTLYLSFRILDDISLDMFYMINIFTFQNPSQWSDHWSGRQEFSWSNTSLCCLCASQHQRNSQVSRSQVSLYGGQIDGLVQDRCNSSALAMELCLSLL